MSARWGPCCNGFAESGKIGLTICAGKRRRRRSSKHMASKLDSIKDWVPFMKRAHFRANEMPAAVGTSGRTLRRIFKREFGKSMQKVLNESRSKEAQDLLRAGYDEKTICDLLGFRSTAHFSDWFKDRCGACPRDFIAASPQKTLSQVVEPEPRAPSKTLSFTLPETSSTAPKPGQGE